ncbi:MAG: hypothetical protein J7L82_07130 [Staphylothermus sp.]|nr:hypothetical protein [Staphylothermus sp.]
MYPKELLMLDIELRNAIERRFRQFLTIIFSTLFGIGLTLTLSLGMSNKIVLGAGILLTTLSLILLAKYGVEPIRIERRMYGYLIVNTFKGEIPPRFNFLAFPQGVAHLKCKNLIEEGIISSEDLRLPEDTNTTHKSPQVRRVLIDIIDYVILYALHAAIFNGISISSHKLTSTRTYNLKFLDAYVFPERRKYVLKLIKELDQEHEIQIPEEFRLQIRIYPYESSTKYIIRGRGWKVYLDVGFGGLSRPPDYRKGIVPFIEGIPITENMDYEWERIAFLRSMLYLINLRVEISTIASIVWHLFGKHQREEATITFLKHLLNDLIVHLDWDEFKRISEENAPSVWIIDNVIKEELEHLKNSMIEHSDNDDKSS